MREQNRFRTGVADDITGAVGYSVFYDIETGFAETITYAAGTDFPGIWEQDYQELDADGYVRVSGTAPACWARTSEAPAVGETIVRNSVSYIIVEHQPNDDGEILMILREA